MKSRAEEERLAAFRELAAAAPEGWLPPIEDRAELNPDVVRKCLGIDPRDTYPDRMSFEQKLQLITLWFNGREQEIPYEEWGLTRPRWIPGAGAAQSRKG